MTTNQTLKVQAHFFWRRALLILTILALCLGQSFLPAPRVLAQEKETETKAPRVNLAAQDPARNRSIAELTPEEKLADYAAFWDIIYDAYPMLGYLRRQGVDPEALKDQYEQGVLGLSTRADWLAYFQRIITDLTMGGKDVGHLSAVGLSNYLLNADYQSYCYFLAEYPDDPWLDMMGEVFENPHVLGFYNLVEEEREPGVEPHIDIPDNLYTEFHPEADWSYLYINSFLNQNMDDQDILADFFMETEGQGIGNVIIDLRDNEGGYNDYWLLNIVAPNIKKALQVENFGLYKESPWTQACLDYYASSTYEEDLVELKEAGPLPTLIFSWNRRPDPLPRMPKLVKEDIDDLEEAFQETIRIAPSTDQPLYTGKIWILSGPLSYSASEYFISFAKRTGFAKIVGEESGGDGSCVVTLYNALPESGLIIRYNALYGLNPDGSPNEDQATQPDFPIAEGQDALNLAVELISKGD
ncbi:MAG: S41 family peptidase [Clostridiales bacterium]|nr:S41 family peptidase [Clostridiales bacterium]